MSRSLPPKLLGPLAVLCLLVTQHRYQPQVDCFSTPSFRASSASTPGSAHRFLASAGRTHNQQDESAEYTNNYITAIEDQTTSPPGFMVSTTDHNYALHSPRLGELDWLGLTVNDAQVFILTKENRTLSASLFTLAESERDFIAEVRAKFTQNLAGLRFAYYTSGSSLALSSAAAYREPASGLAATSTGGGGYSPAAVVPVEHQTVASNAISQLNGVNYLASLQEQRRRAFALGLPEPTSGAGGGPEDVRYSLGGFMEKRSRVGAPGDRFLGPSLGYKHARARGVKRARDKQQAAAVRHASGSYRVVDELESSWRQSETNKPPASPQPTKYNKCSFQNLVNLNYYNLNQRQTGLNRTLAGDIYYFDFHCNILDVYSATVSVRRQPDASILYRDHRYFAYTRAQLPLEINKLFLVGDQVFFVYNDGSLLLKQSWMLEPAELHLVLGVRQELKGVSEWQGRAADLTSKDGSSATPAPEEDATTETTSEKPRGSKS